MKQIRLIWFGVFFIVGLIHPWLYHVPVWGHLPAGKLYKAFQFPAQLEPVIDADLGDWRVVDSSYMVATDDFFDLLAQEDSMVDLADFSVRLMIGWSQTGNKLFVAAQVDDDIHQIDRAPGTAGMRIFQDDDMEVFIDADHSGGQYANFTDLSPEEQLQLNGASASHFVLAGPPPDGDYFVNFSAAEWYSLHDGEYSKAAYHFDESTGTTTYELMVVPFDNVDMRTAILSREHILRENEILGFNVEFNDFDSMPELFDAKWSLSGGHNSFRFSERFGDLRLMPLEDIFGTTSIESQSWGRIKATFLN